MNRFRPIWDRNMEEEEERTKEYLYLAFQKCKARMEKEQISSFEEYDEKYSIHYRLEEWLCDLCGSLYEDNDMERYKELKNFCDSLQK